MDALHETVRQREDDSRCMALRLCGPRADAVIGSYQVRADEDGVVATSGAANDLAIIVLLPCLAAVVRDGRVGRRIARLRREGWWKGAAVLAFGEDGVPSLEVEGGGGLGRIGRRRRGSAGGRFAMVAAGGVCAARNGARADGNGGVNDGERPGACSRDRGGDAERGRRAGEEQGNAAHGSGRAWGSAHARAPPIPC